MDPTATVAAVDAIKPTFNHLARYIQVLEGTLQKGTEKEKRHMQLGLGGAKIEDWMEFLGDEDEDEDEEGNEEELEKEKGNIDKVQTIFSIVYNDRIMHLRKKRKRRRMK